MPKKENSLISKIREYMKGESLDYIIVPSSDPHLSEYVASHWKIREWISGFTGSAGTLILGKSVVGLWTDSRYALQANNELGGTEIEIHITTDASNTYTKWLTKNINSEEVIGIDGRLVSSKQLNRLKKELRGKNAFIRFDIRLADLLWDRRPPLPTAKIFDFDVRYAGLPRSNKISLIRRKMKEVGVEWHLITTLDDIAWLFNLRGRDVDYNPVFYAFALIGIDESFLFINPLKVPGGLKGDLNRDLIFIEPYEKAYNIKDLVTGKILVNPDDANHLIMQQLDRDLVVTGKTPSRLIKAKKTQIEIQHIENAMVKDGIALIDAFMWLEYTLNERPISEYEFARKLSECRSRQEGYFGESFSAIVGYEANGAIVHYRPPKEGSAKIYPKGILLCDSGGQYIDGTTDITRTIALSEPTKEVRKAYTRVLKGHIALDKIHYPKGTTGSQLDTLARQFLWQEGMNYGHGTGHGVGFFLNVHEPPQGYSPGRSDRAMTVLEPGMISSNEPGYYKNGAFGIRIENLLLVEESVHEGFLKHRHLTWFPLDTQLIDLEEMNEEDVRWVNGYHREVLAHLSIHLDSERRDWLLKKCREL